MTSPAAQPLERRIVSVLFADLVGFTSLSEGLDAEEVAAVQDQYFAQVRETIDRYGGRLEKFIGDAAMAVFGVPRTRDDDAERAVRAGLALIGAVEALSARVGLEEGALRLRVGVNTGEVAYAPAEDGQWRVSGDAVNTAARLQTAAEPGTVLVGDGTALSVAEVIVVERPIELELKGKAEPVRAWRAVGPLPERSRERAMGALRAPLLGRQAELGQIEAAVERARAGATEALLVIAPPGAGKTRLVEELVSRVWQTAGTAPVLRARLRPETMSPESVAGQLLASTLDHQFDSEAMNEAVTQPSRLELAAELLRRALPPGRADELASEVGRLLSEPDSPAAAGAAPSGLAEEREVRFRAWIEALDALQGERPQIWLVEDLHWSGGDILAFVEQAAAQPSRFGRLVLGTARPLLLEQLAARPPDSPPLATLELAPLAGADARALISALVGEALTDALVDAVAERSDGNPLFIEELLRSWISLGTLVPTEDGNWLLTSPPEDVSLPQTVQQIYAAQLDDLPGPARALVRRASVAGRHVPRHSLDALEVAQVDEGLDVARRRTLLTDGTRDAVSGPSLVYRHALLRDAGYGSLARAERSRLHARLARWYETAAANRVDEVAEQIAGHYDAAVEHSSRLSPQIDVDLDVGRARALAVSWFERAAARALAGAAHETGRALLRRALRHAAESEPLVRGRLLLTLGEATAYTAGMAEGAALLEEAIALYQPRLDDGTETQRDEARAGYAAAVAALGRVWIQQVRFDDTKRLVDEALARLGETDEPAIAPLFGIRGWVRSTLTMERSAIDDVDRALAIARRSSDRRLELEMLDWRAAALGELDEYQPEDWTMIADLAVELGDWRRALKAMRMQAGAHVDDEHELVWPLADRAEEIARRRGLLEDLCWLDYLRTEAGFASGNWDLAMDAGGRVFELGERNSYDRVVVRTLHALLPMATARGDRALVEHAFAWHEARRHIFPDSPYARIMRAAIELHAMRAGLMPPAVPEVEPRLGSFEGEPGGPSWLAACETVVESWLADGQLAAADEAVARMEAGAAGAPATSSLGRGTVAHLRARVLTVREASPADLEAAARSALGHFRAARAPWWIAKSLAVLERAGVSTSDEERELRAIESGLGLASPGALPR